MVISRISHGLGNQLFQYAIGRALSISNQSPLKLDLSHFETYHDRNYGLEHFNIAASVAVDSEIRAISGCSPGKHKRGLARHFDALMRLFNQGAKRIVCRDSGKGFDPTVLESKGEIYLLGYWQSPAYVEAAGALLRRELSFKNAPSEENRRWLDRIGQSHSVSIHIRRGDYIKHARFEMPDPLSYYQRAFEMVAEKHADICCYVFSDDISWAKSNLHLPCNLHFIGHNNIAPHEDMRLMSSCRHQIIANSTFSWWAAWLNSNPSKIVCAPLSWFQDSPEARADIIPTDWHRC